MLATKVYFSLRDIENLVKSKLPEEYKNRNIFARAPKFIESDETVEFFCYISDGDIPENKDENYEEKPVRRVLIDVNEIGNIKED